MGSFPPHIPPSHLHLLPTVQLPPENQIVLMSVSMSEVQHPAQIHLMSKHFCCQSDLFCSCSQRLQIPLSLTAAVHPFSNLFFFLYFALYFWVLFYFIYLVHSSNASFNFSFQEGRNKRGNIKIQCKWLSNMFWQSSCYHAGRWNRQVFPFSVWDRV